MHSYVQSFLLRAKCQTLTLKYPVLHTVHFIIKILTSIIQLGDPKNLEKSGVYNKG